MISKTQITDIQDNGYLRYSSSEGEFFIYFPKNKSIGGTYLCRDEFAWEWEIYKVKKHCYIGFTTGNDINITHLNKFWSLIEKNLGIDVPTIFYSTDTGAVILKLSPFWVKTETHKAVCTLLLRMIVCYPASTLDKMINSYHLTKACRRALKWFLKGNTEPTYKEWNEEYRKWVNSSLYYRKTHIEPECLEDDEGLTGFVAEFQNASMAVIKKKLVKP